jgi:periplasmic protein TonB
MKATLLLAAAALELAANVEPMRLGPDMNPPSIITKTQPEYTQQAREAKYQGSVLIDAVIGKDGHAKHAVVRRGLGMGLDEKALEAVTKWRFEPARLRKDNTPVEVRVTIEMNFRLK